MNYTGSVKGENGMSKMFIGIVTFSILLELLAISAVHLQKIIELLVK